MDLRFVLSFVFWISCQGYVALFENMPLISVEKTWEEAILGGERRALERVLAEYLQSCRWFGGKARPIADVRIEEAIGMAGTSSRSYVLFMAVRHADGYEAMYVLPVIHALGQESARIHKEYPAMAITRLHVDQTGQDGLLCDAFVEKTFCADLLTAIGRSQRMEGRKGILCAFSSADMCQRPGYPACNAHESSVLSAEQSNTSVLYGRDFLLKVFRRLEQGINPEYEVGRFLTKAGFRNIPPVLGAVEYCRTGEEPITVAVLHGYVPNDGDAWTYTLDALGHFFERIPACHSAPPLPIHASFLDMSETDMDPDAERWLGPYAESARCLGERTAELHTALASSTRDPAFVPEPFTPLYLRMTYDRLHALTESTFQLLRQRLDDVPEAGRPAATRVLGLKVGVLDHFRFLRKEALSSVRIRCHGDFHLGQVLFTGNDFVMIDFEGEPAHSLNERRGKSSPLKDVSGMIRSFEYAVCSALIDTEKSGRIRTEDRLHLESWGEYWSRWICACFLKSYVHTAREAGILPRDRNELGMLLSMHLLEKAVYELSYELNHRPSWVSIPLQGILRLVESSQTGTDACRPCGIDSMTDCTCLQERYA